MLTTPSYASAHYTKEYDPELAAKALKPFAKGTIGYVGIYQMSFAMVDYIKRAFPQARFVDASEMVDRIKVIKSAEELELVRRAALMQDGAMRAAFAAIKPGMRDTEVAAVAAALQPGPRQRERHLSLRLDAARHAVQVRQAPCAEPHHPEGRSDRAAGRG